jgi:hypothetical protein
MVDGADLRTRAATLADAAAIAAIYNEGIVDRVATFETEPRSSEQISQWFTARQLVIVAETAKTGPVAFAASFPYSASLLRRHRRILRLCETRLSRPRRWPFGARRADRGGYCRRLAQAHQPGISRKRREPGSVEESRFRRNRDSSSARQIGWRLA